MTFLGAFTLLIALVAAIYAVAIDRQLGELSKRIDEMDKNLAEAHQRMDHHEADHHSE